MARSQQTWNKKEREKQKQKARQEKAERKKERRENSKVGTLENMMAYLDENGNLSATPPDPSKRIIVKAEDIEIGVPKQKPVDPADLIRKGKVTFFNDAKGYGFIVDRESGQSLFVHVKSCAEPIQQGSEVTFEIEMGPKGANAVNVTLL